MRLAFAGTPVFAQAALAALLDAGHEIVLVLSQPDRPAGRGLKLQASPVKRLALERGLAIAQPRSLRLDGRFPDDAKAARMALERAAPQMLIVAAYGLILPEWTLALPPAGCLNIHASLLPRWRGAAPIQRAIEAGDTRTGITIMQMDAGLDTGPMLLAEALPIAADDTGATLHDRLAALGARLVVAALEAWQQGRRVGLAQPAEGASYARKIDKREAVIDWQAPAALIERRLRAFDPAPGCSTALGGQTVKVWRADVVAASEVVNGFADPAAGEGAAGPPGSVLSADADRLVLACGEGALALRVLQLPGGGRITVREFLRRHPWSPA